MHASGVVSEPPEHDQRGSTVHDAEQPSPATVLLSSQPSEAKGIARRPSPHTGEHVSSPPTPEPPSASEEETRPSHLHLAQRVAAVAAHRVVVVAPLERRAPAADVDHRREVESLLFEVVVGGDSAVAGGVGASEGVVAGCFGIIGRLR